MSKYNALVLGCGNIGALYDFDNNQVQSHAKAYSLKPLFELSVFDPDLSLAEKIAKRYNATVIYNIEEINFEDFDCISICSPTDSHYSFLEKALKANVKVILCEKPVSYSIKEIENLIDLQKKSKSNVFVNYIRRFQPSYYDLKCKLKEVLDNDSLSSVSISYQKGFINNCSHALDTLEFILDKEITLKNLQISNVKFDFFKHDPTLSLSAIWDQTPLNIIGLTTIDYPIFEINLFFCKSRLSITNSGQKITIFSAKNESFSLPLAIEESYTRVDCLNNYMIPIIDLVENCLTNTSIENNFVQALSLNKKMLEILSESNE
jgi:hypothetical protein